MNINMLTDADNDAGFYAAANGGATSWRGATLTRSTDLGATYHIVGAFDTPATMGTTVGALGNFLGGNIPDELNKLTVNLSYGEIASVSYASFINGAQAAVIGSEIVYYREAILNVDGSYTLRGLLRGRRGSEYAMSAHVPGERIIFLAVNSIKRISDLTSSIGVERLYKAITLGQSTGTTKTFTNTASGLKPYSVAQLGGGRSLTGDLQVTWARRARMSGEWRDLVDVPLGEDSEAYVVEIWDSGRTTLKRTISGLTSAFATYAAAQQVTDFGGLQSSIAVSVYQLSAIVGRGYEARVTL